MKQLKRILVLIGVIALITISCKKSKKDVNCNNKGSIHIKMDVEMGINGVSFVDFYHNGQVVASLKNGQEITLTPLEAGEYDISAMLDDRLLYNKTEEVVACQTTEHVFSENVPS